MNITKSTVDVTIDASTVDTREPDRDKDLRSDKFFDVAHYPSITFSQEGPAGRNRQTQSHGDLTIHGTTKEVVLDVEGPDCFCERSLGQRARSRYGHNQGQPPGLRREVERHLGQRRCRRR